MLVYHSTDAAGRKAIEETGFRSSVVRDSAKLVWFCETKDPNPPARGHDWWVVVDVGDADPAPWEYPFDDGSIYRSGACRYFRIPVDFVNGSQPFRFERRDQATR